MMFVASLLLSVASLAPTPDADPVRLPPSAGAGPEYEACIAAVAASPVGGQRHAESWLGDGGGAPARHCVAVAALAMNAPASAAIMLMELAAGETADPGLAARLYLQAASAFMQAGLKDEAFAALRSTYDLVPDAPEVHMTAATIYATGDRWDGVILTLTALEKFAALSADAFVLRGRAHLEEGQTDKAAHDAARALALDPYLVDGLVLRGDLAAKGVALPKQAPTP